MPSNISAAEQLTESKLGAQALVEGPRWFAPFYTGLGLKAIALKSDSAVQFGRRLLPSESQQHQEGDA